MARSSHHLARGYSLMEIVLVFVLLTAAAALIAPRLLSGEHAGAARSAQASIETAVAAGLQLYEYGSAPTADLGMLEELAPRLTFVDSVSASSDTETVSVGASAEILFLAATDGYGTCWGLMNRVAGTGVVSIYLALDLDECTAAAVAAKEGFIPPAGTGTSWDSPWLS